VLLEGKVAVIYGGSGNIGGAAARAFAREGARVFLAGRTISTLEATASDIRSNGGIADVAVVDALDARRVNVFVDNVAAQAGRLDISFNVIDYRDVQRPLLEITLDEFEQPIVTATRTQFLTTAAAARHMMARKSGAILTFGGSGPQTLPGLGGFKIALDAVEGLRRQWACELGPYGIRVISMKTGGIPETMPQHFPGRDDIVKSIVDGTLLKWAATLEDVGNVAAFLVSDQARTMTSTEVNISCGALMD
jgi:NAD(P)-dependent dehydrogenase (short-subunit alcohol dehydrogenase family)